MVDLSANEIVNGNISKKEEDSYYQKSTMRIIEAISVEHKIDIKKLYEGEALRFKSHVENASIKKYPDLDACNEKLFVACKFQIIDLLNKGLGELHHKNSFFSISLSDL